MSMHGVYQISLSLSLSHTHTLYLCVFVCLTVYRSVPGARERHRGGDGGVPANQHPPARRGVGEGEARGLLL
jgi:hypothetical protein